MDRRIDGWIHTYIHAYKDRKIDTYIHRYIDTKKACRKALYVTPARVLQQLRKRNEDELQHPH